MKILNLIKNTTGALIFMIGALVILNDGYKSTGQWHVIAPIIVITPVVCKLIIEIIKVEIAKSKLEELLEEDE